MHSLRAPLVTALSMALAGCGDFRPINPGASCEIYTGVGDAGIAQVSGRDFFPDIIHGGTDTRGEVGGFYEPLANGHSRIYIRDLVGPGGWTLAHEMEHNAEHALEAAGDAKGAKLMREIFRGYMSDSFEFGDSDLLELDP